MNTTFSLVKEEEDVWTPNIFLLQTLEEEVAEQLPSWKNNNNIIFQEKRGKKNSVTHNKVRRRKEFFLLTLDRSESRKKSTSTDGLTRVVSTPLFKFETCGVVGGREEG